MELYSYNEEINSVNLMKAVREHLRDTWADDTFSLYVDRKKVESQCNVDSLPIT